MNWNFVFVILHYCAIGSTIESIESIRQNLGKECSIVVVDNASPDQSGEGLARKYKDENGIYVILNGKNDGFARGNNIGYQYAKEKLHADFIIVMNNDVLIVQKDFLQRITSIYKNKGFDILGPDIVTPEGEHRSPHRLQTFGKKDLNRIIRNRKIILVYLRLKKILHLGDKIMLVEKWDAKRSLAERSNIDRERMQENVVLQGSCLVFSKEFLEKEEMAFYPGTFMWMEEEILTYLSQKKGYRILYHPDIRVIHKEEVSTKQSKEAQDRYYFFSQQLRKSAKVMRSLMDHYEKRGVE